MDYNPLVARGAVEITALRGRILEELLGRGWALVGLSVLGVVLPWGLLVDGIAVFFCLDGLSGVVTGSVAAGRS